MEQVKDGGVKSNMNVDYVINYCFGDATKNEGIAQFEKLLEAVANVGLATEVRQGEKHSLLVFVKVASLDHLYGEVYRSRVQDWIQGVRSSRPENETKTALESDPLCEAERLRIIYQLLTNSKEEGGAEITPKQGEWKLVDSIFALHDDEYNKEWIKHCSTRYILTADDLDEIRNRLGEKIGYYFAFTQSYFTFLVFPAAFGFSAWFLFGHFSLTYAVINGLWCIVFTEYWKHQEDDLAVRWGVRGVSRIESQRREFQYEKIITDPVTGEKVRIFSATKRLQRQLLQIPFALGAALALGTLIATCFGIEIFISEIYRGPLKSYLVFLPTVILTVFMPILTGIITNFATRLTNYENYQTADSYESAMTQKIFVINFITSYLPIILTAFVYVPFGSIIVPYLDVFRLTVRPFCEDEKQMQVPKSGFVINPERLRHQVIYFTVTAQLVNLCLEVIVPYLKRRGMSKVKQIQNEYAVKHGGAAPLVGENDAPDEAAFLTRVRKEVELEVYDVTTDLREMVIQFGYLSLFSVIWPLVGCSFLVNNWIELRADALKICVGMRRPTPQRADTIGPWLDSLSFLTWVGSITTAALVYMFSNDGLGPDGTPQDIKGWALMLSVFFSEHVFLAVRWGVRLALKKAIESPGLAKERRERYMIRKRYFEESLRELEKIPKVKDELPVTFERETLGEKDEAEVKAGKGSLSSIGIEERFWARQRGWREAAAVGANFIDRWGPDEEAKKDR